MRRRDVILLVVVLSIAFGIWRLLHAVPLLFAAPADSLVAVSLAIQGALALVVAGALFLASASAALLVLLLALVIAIHALFESFVWEIRAPLGGVAICALALLAALTFARFLRAPRDA